MVTTMERPTARSGRKIASATADPRPPQTGEDGYPVRLWEVDGAEQPFSLKPYPVEERPVYWYPGRGAHMWWRAQSVNEYGLQPIVQKEVWIEGAFAPRNAWEEHMTREWLTRHQMDPDKSKGENHPDGPGHAFRCECAYLCPNWHVFQMHQRRTGHTRMRSE